MSRSNSVYKVIHNRCLDLVKSLGPGEDLPPETELAARLDASRTTVRAVLEHLNATGVIRWSGRSKTIIRLPAPPDYFAEEETLSATERVETAFMEYILSGDLKPGAILRESELAREFAVSHSAIREYLIRFSRFGLIEKKPNRHWVLNGFTRDFAIEVFDVREMFELRALRDLLAHPLDAATLAELRALAKQHKALLERIDDDFLRFPRLDERFHKLITARLHNRFVDDFFALVSLIFHFHYRWNKALEKDRNRYAAIEHLAVIEALLKGDTVQAETAFRQHLQSARQTLMDSVQWD
ncbi:MAG: GntR family transcriptional regulator [Rhodobacteraceae bacterium]|nr:GntR family transcriptional regulator [Paracoccaceae bacterium]